MPSSWLRSLVELRDVGLRKPLPLPIATSAAWAEEHARGLRGADADEKRAARREWETDRFAGTASFSKEDEDAYHVRVFGPRATVESLLDAGLPTYAWQVWEPLLSGVEKVGPYDAQRPTRGPSRSPTRCRPAPCCSRPVPAPARRGRSARS